MSDDVLFFGGTFDPVHNGHLAVARALAELRGFERVVFVPTSNPPHKPAASADAADRLAMLELATAGEELLAVSEVELGRSGASYTYDTLLALREEYGPSVRLHWMIGADMLAELHKWHRAEEVVEMAEFVIVMRPPWHERIEEVFRTLEGHFRPDVVEKLRSSVVDTPLVDISSTDIRRRVAAGEPVGDLVPDEVAAYIARRGLYCRADRS